MPILALFTLTRKMREWPNFSCPRKYADGIVGGTKNMGFAVLIAPQSRAQETALKEILQEHDKEQRLGGEVYAVGHYYSRAYADMVCSWYRDTGYLTINEHLVQQDVNAE